MWNTRSNVAHKGLDMNNLELIHELDDRLELVRTAWSEELVKIVNDPQIEPNSRAYQKAVSKISKKFSPLMAKILVARQDAFDREYAYQQSLLKNNSQTSNSGSKVDENGRPVDKYWKDGKWQYYKKPKQED